jgi:hypothetical protein
MTHEVVGLPYWQGAGICNGEIVFRLPITAAQSKK